MLGVRQNQFHTHYVAYIWTTKSWHSVIAKLYVTMKKKKGSFETIFNKDVLAEVVETLTNIDKFRTSVLNK